MRRGIICMVLGLLSCGESSPTRTGPTGAGPASHPRPKLPDSIPKDDEQCSSCKLSDQGVCELHYIFGCGEATCGKEIPCDLECCRDTDSPSFKQLQERAKTGAIEGLGPLVQLGRSFEIDGVPHHIRIEHLVGMQPNEQSGIYWYVEHSYPHDNHEQLASQIWRVSTGSPATQLYDADAQITDLELHGEWLLFTEYGAEQTNVYRMRAVGGRPELIGTWPGNHALMPSDDGSLLVVGDTGIAIDPGTKHQSTFTGTLANPPAPDLTRCNMWVPGERQNTQSVHAFDDHLFWTIPLDPEVWNGLGIGQLLLLRHCPLDTGKVETLGLFQTPNRGESWPLELAFTKPYLVVAFVDGVYIDYINHTR